MYFTDHFKDNDILHHAYRYLFLENKIYWKETGQNISAIEYTFQHA